MTMPKLTSSMPAVSIDCENPLFRSTRFAGTALGGILPKVALTFVGPTSFVTHWRLPWHATAQLFSFHPRAG